MQGRKLCLNNALKAFICGLCLPPEIETVKLARLVYSKLHEICSSWVKDFPLQPKPHRYYETSIHAIKNMRRKMEDKHVCIPDFNVLFNLEVSSEGETQFCDQCCWIRFSRRFSTEEVKGDGSEETR